MPYILPVTRSSVNFNNNRLIGISRVSTFADLSGRTADSGELIFVTTGTDRGVYIYDGTSWVLIASDAGGGFVQQPTSGNETITEGQIVRSTGGMYYGYLLSDDLVINSATVFTDEATWDLVSSEAASITLGGVDTDVITNINAGVNLSLDNDGNLTISSVASAVNFGSPGNDITFREVTLAEYTGLPSRDPNTLYHITDDANVFANVGDPITIQGVSPNAIPRNNAAGMALEDSSITDNDLVVDIDSACRIEGCLDILVPEVTIPITADGVLVATSRSNGSSLAGGTNVVVNDIGTTANPAIDISVGDPIHFPSLPGIGIKIITLIEYNIQGSNDRFQLTRQPLEETILSNTDIYIPPNSDIGVLAAFSNTGATSILISGDITSDVSNGDVIFFRSSSQNVAGNGTIEVSAVALDGANTRISFLTPLLSNVQPGTQVGRIDSTGTVTLAADTVATIERDLTSFSSQNIRLDVTQSNPNLAAGSLRVSGPKRGTLASPPSGMVVDELWFDTTTSSTHPIPRVSTVAT